jgi:hypothetical protein
MKSGTSWLSRNLEASTQYSNGGLKEWRFWSAYLNPSLYPLRLERLRKSDKVPDQIRYRMLLQPEKYISEQIEQVVSSTQLRVLGDLTPGIGLEPANLHKLSAKLFASGLECKGLFLMRDPVERAISELFMKIRTGRPGYEIDLDSRRVQIERRLDEIARSNSQDLLQRSRYEETLVNCSEVGDTIPYKTMFFEEMFSQSHLDSITNFVGIRPVPINTEIVFPGRKLEIPRATREFLANELRQTYPIVEARHGGHLPDAWRSSMDLISRY